MLSKRILISDVKLTLEDASIFGRIMAIRKMKNYIFADIMDVSGKMQVIIPVATSTIALKISDIVSFRGNPVISKAGQLSLEVSEVTILSRGSESAASIIGSNASNALDIRGQRPLALMIDESLRNSVTARSILLGSIREHFRSAQFLEVDTPVMSYARFAGTADVFETKSRTLDKNLYLRGTLEDYLKQLVVSGFEKVFQIGDCFRNESPALIQFTMLEATWAYARSEDMLEFIQRLISKICVELPDGLVDNEAKAQLAQPIEVVSFWGVLETEFGRDIRKLGREEVVELAKDVGFEFHTPADYEFELAKFGYEVIKRKLAHEFLVPTFVGRFPSIISPLAKAFEDGSGEADRGYGFFRGQRLFEVVEEASSYAEQLQKFQAQDDRSKRSSRSFKHDDLLTALSYGCPPMAGLGFNVNRVLAVLLNVTSSADVVPFPLTKSDLPL